MLGRADKRASSVKARSQVSRPFMRVNWRSIARRLGEKYNNFLPHGLFVMGSPEFREAGAGGLIAGWFQVMNKFGFALGGAVGQFEAEGSRIVVP